jgi:hypothetical protein
MMALGWVGIAMLGAVVMAAVGVVLYLALRHGKDDRGD